MTNVKKLLMASGGIGGGGIVPDNLFSAFLYTGTGSAKTNINNIDLSTEDGLVWIKKRNDSGQHTLIDTVRGNTKYIRSSADHAEGTGSDMITAFNSNGFSVGTNDDVGTNNIKYATWTFREAPRFFNIQTWTGNGSSGRQIPHALETSPGMIFIKQLNGSTEWSAWHKDLTQGSTYMVLNSNSGASSSSEDIKSVSTSTFTIGSNSRVNQSSSTYVAYIFAHNNSDGNFGPDSDQDIIKCGSYTGNGNSVGPAVDVGFEPQFIMVKQKDGTGDWLVFDAMRGLAAYEDRSDQVNKLYWNMSASEITSGGPRTARLHNGFQVVNSSSEANSNGSSYIYMAIRVSQLTTPTAGSEVFDIDSVNPGYGPVTTSFPVDLNMSFKNQGGTNNNNMMIDRLRMDREVRTLSNSADGGVNVQMDQPDNSQLINYTWGNDQSIYYTWKRAAGFFDIVMYQGNGSSQTLNHQLGVVPRLIVIKKLGGTSNWYVYNAHQGTSKHTTWNGSGPVQNQSFVSSLTTTQFTIGTLVSGHYDSSNSYVAYLWGDVSGVQKIGGYTGNSTNPRVITTGFQARFVAIHNSQDWYFMDSVRGLGYSARFSSNAGGQSLSNYIYANANGFTLNSSVVNTSTTDYVYWAIG
tara:strand:- start:2963 stop:4861 length:1899 start_codon:yes stop_codon:yes gene_type:complete